VATGADAQRTPDRAGHRLAAVDRVRSMLRAAARRHRAQANAVKSTNRIGTRFDTGVSALSESRGPNFGLREPGNSAKHTPAGRSRNHALAIVELYSSKMAQ
jgi:hypothetical protein